MNAEDQKIIDDTSKKIVLIALKVTNDAFDRFIGECMIDGKPALPSASALMKARAYLPPYCKNAFKD